LILADGTAEAGKVYTEEDWMEADRLDAHGKSKVLAEKAAWEYVKELPGTFILSDKKKQKGG